jgi:hypothetical protein
MTESRRENKGKLQRTQKILMFNRCKSICKNGRIPTTKKDLFERTED